MNSRDTLPTKADRCTKHSTTGSVYITFQHKKGFSVWLLLNGYANYESSNEKIVLYEATLGAYEYGHATRFTYALHCASKVLEKNKIVCSVGVWMD